MFNKNVPTVKDALCDDARVISLPKRPRQRVWEIDFVRGICVILMILDHLAILLGTVFAPSWYGYNFYSKGIGDSFSSFCYYWSLLCPERDIIHPIVLFIFFSLSGISCTFSRSNLKRGLQLALVAILYTVGSYIAENVIGIYGTFVTFGVLHFLAVCILTYAVIEILVKKSSIGMGLASTIIIIITLCLYFCYTPPKDTSIFFCWIFPPRDFYGNPSLFYTQSQVSPGDLFTMIPYTAFYFSGVLMAQFLYPVKTSILPKLDRAWHKPFTFVGKHALIIYVAHLVLLAGVLALVSYFYMTPGEFF